jgi:NAD(P)-dependent dehydrogenase (short-subunit alcohol dehydrogenase family)
MSAFGYDGQRVVLTGAATGVGAATTRMLADLGAQVHALDVVDVDGPIESFHQCDVSDPAAIAAAVAEIGAPIHKLFNIAGVPQTRPADSVIAVNFLGLRELTEVVLPLMPAGGAVAHVASIAGMGWLNRLDTVRELVETPDFAAGLAWTDAHLADQGDPYFFSKECVIVYTMLRARPCWFDGRVRMNCVSPGPIESPMMPEFRTAMGSGTIDWTAAQSAGRLATPSEIAPALVFLNADESSYVNGLNLVVDAAFGAASTMGQVDYASLTA